ncbi:hypothetical protein D9757_013788 [Collybiopsis confluens]|uniref:Vacuolar fusion protein MON1 n=1 Tax=Collybiopsis confluens TaxID=2823264 RepID=A0A8H5FPN6_9AGAR|nr:hypothetical protein D9757_013788 [Collybiopsis confluens]
MLTRLMGCNAIHVIRQTHPSTAQSKRVFKERKLFYPSNPPPGPEYEFRTENNFAFPVRSCLSFVAVPTLSLPNNTGSSSASSSSNTPASSTSSNSTVAASASTASVASTTNANVSTATSATSASTTAAPTTSAGKNAKRGLSYPGTDNPQDVMNINQTKSQISWQYDWGLAPPLNLAQSGVEYIPMQWGSSGIENLSQALQSMGAKTLLTFNEPDFSQQSNIDPNTAAQLWIQHIEPLRKDIPGIKIGAPAVSSGGTGFPWLTTFFGACGNCTFDFLPIHWYGEGAAGFYDYLYQMYGEFGNKTIWVTEYADTSLNETDVITFINQTTAFMDGLAFVERSDFVGQRPENGSAYNMLNANGSLNALGQLYIGADTVEASGPATNTAAGIPAGGPGGPATITAGPGHAPTFTPNSALSGLGNHRSPAKLAIPPALRQTPSLSNLRVHSFNAGSTTAATDDNDVPAVPPVPPLPPMLPKMGGSTMGMNSSASSVFNLELDNSNGKMMVQDVEAEVESVDEEVYQNKFEQDGESKKLRDQLRRTLSRTTFTAKARPSAHWLPDARKSFDSKLSPRQYFILTDAGKPVFISRGSESDDSDISSMIGVMQALISVFIDDGDKLKAINAGKTRITFLQRPSLYYVCVSAWGEPESVTRSHLEYLHLQIISVVTAAQLKRIFERRGNFDLRRLLGGADTFLTTMISRLQLDLAISMSALRCLRLDPALRNKCALNLVPSGKNAKDIIYVMLVARGEIITLIRPKKHSVHPAASPSISNSLAAAMWVPLCLPKWNEGRMVNAYVVNMPSAGPSPPSTSRSSPSSSPGPSIAPSVAGGTDSATNKRRDSATVTDSDSVTLVCINGGTEFDLVKAWCDEAIDKLCEPSLSGGVPSMLPSSSTTSSSNTSSTLTITPQSFATSSSKPQSQATSNNNQSGHSVPPTPVTPALVLHPSSSLYQLHSYLQAHSSYTVSELGIPGLRHFVYKARGLVQVTFPVWEDVGDMEVEVDALGSTFNSGSSSGKKGEGEKRGKGKKKEKREGKGKGKERVDETRISESGDGNENTQQQQDWDSSTSSGSSSEWDYGRETVTLPTLRNSSQDDERRRIVTLYQLVHDAIHAKGVSGQSKGDAKEGLKLQYLRTDKEAVLGWITQPFELYLTLSPLLPKSAAIGAANAVAHWVKKEETKLFLRDAPVF